LDRESRLRTNNASAGGPPRTNWSLLVGFDIFISYKRSEAGVYANDLYSRLRGEDYLCFLDDHEAPPGAPLNSSIDRALRRSRVLIFIATREALQSDWVGREIERFGTFGRPLIPINIGRALNEVPLEGTRFEVLKRKDVIWVDEAVYVLPSGHPTDQVLDNLRRLFVWRRAKRNIQAILGAVIAALLAFSLFSLIQKRAADHNRDLANEAAGEAQRQKKAADDSAVYADKQRDIADTQKRAAQKSAQIAEVQRQIAVDNQHEAEVQRDLAVGRRMLTEANSVAFEGNQEKRALLAAASVKFFGDQAGSESNDAMRGALAALPARLLHLRNILGTTFTGNPNELATINKAGMLTVWDITLRQPIRQHTCDPRPTSIAYDSRRNVLVTLAPDLNVTLWSADFLEKTKTLKAPFEGHMMVDPGGRYAVLDRSVRTFSRPADPEYSLVDLDSGELISLDKTDAIAEQIVFSKDGTRLAVHFSSVKDSSVQLELRDATSQRVVLNLPIEAKDAPGGGATAANMFFSEDSASFVVSTAADIRSWGSKSGNIEPRFGKKSVSGVESAAYFDTSRSGLEDVVTPVFGGFVVTDPMKSGSAKLIGEPHLMDFVFSPMGRYLVAHGGSTGGTEAHTYVWDRLEGWGQVRLDDAETILFNSTGALMVDIDNFDNLSCGILRIGGMQI
jgi:hypothetical protein